MAKRFEFCRICRQNHNQGRGHRYSSKHKHCVEILRKKILDKVQEVRYFVKNVLPVTNRAPDSSKFWCHFCEEEIAEQQSLIVCAQAINHLASQNHAEKVKSFWAENGGDLDQQHMYVIQGADLERWKEECKLLPDLVGMDGPSLSGVHNLIQPDENLPVVSPNEEVLLSPVLSASSTAALTVIRVHSFGTGEDNVHSGVAPPWQSIGEGEVFQMGGANSSMQLFPLSRAKKIKLAKMRDPNRVGAAWAERRRVELEREQGGEAVTKSMKGTWVPNFGSVWQSGPRRDTRKEFEAEELSESQKQGKGRRGLSTNNTTSGRVEFKPYISRKQRQSDTLTILS